MFKTTVTKIDNLWIASMMYQSSCAIKHGFGIRQYKHCSSAHRAIRNYLNKLKGL